MRADGYRRKLDMFDKLLPFLGGLNLALQHLLGATEFTCVDSRTTCKTLDVF